MKGLFIPEITAEMFRNGCLESIEALMAEGTFYDIEYQPTTTERKRGEWQAVNLDVRAWTVQCSNCNCIGLYGKTAFCPNCGARMVSE